MTEPADLRARGSAGAFPRLLPGMTAWEWQRIIRTVIVMLAVFAVVGIVLIPLAPLLRIDPISGMIVVIVAGLLTLLVGQLATQLLPRSGAEARAGYTTLPGGDIELVHLHWATGEVVRPAGATPLTPRQFRRFLAGRLSMVEVPPAGALFPRGRSWAPLVIVGGTVVLFGVLPWFGPKPETGPLGSIVGAVILAIVLLLPVADWARRRRIRRFSAGAMLFGVALTPALRQLVRSFGTRVPDIALAMAVVTPTRLDLWVGGDIAPSLPLPWVHVRSIEPRPGRGLAPPAIVLTLHPHAQGLRLELPIRSAFALVQPSGRRLNELLATMRTHVEATSREHPARYGG